MTRTLARSLAVALSVTALVGGASACSSDDAQPSASTLVSDAQKASTSAKSTDVVIAGDVNGTKTSMTLDGTMDGSNQKQIQTQGDGRSEGIVLGKDAYLKGNTAFWKAIGTPDAAAPKLNDKWWKGAPGTGSNPAIDVKKLLTDFFASDEGKRLAAGDAKVSKTTTDGVDTYTLSDPKASGNAKLIVKRDGDHQVVRIDNYSSSLTNTKASYTFSKWNDAETYTAPAGAQPISSVK